MKEKYQNNNRKCHGPGGGAIQPRDHSAQYSKRASHTTVEKVIYIWYVTAKNHRTEECIRRVDNFEEQAERN